MAEKKRVGRDIPLDQSKEPKKVAVTLKNYKELHAVYQKGLDDDKGKMDVVKWNDCEFVMAYLFYVLMFMEMQSKEIATYARKHKMERRTA